MNRLETYTECSALFLPSEIEDNTYVIDDLSALNACIGIEIIVYGLLELKGTHHSKRRVPFNVYQFIDATTFLSFALFGNDKLKMPEPDQYVYVKGTIELNNGKYTIAKPRIVTADKVNKIVPIYDGIKGKVPKHELNEAMHSNLKETDIVDGAKILESELKRTLGSSFDSVLDELGFVCKHSIVNSLRECHKPQSVHSFYQSIRMLKRLSATILASSILKSRDSNAVKKLPPCTKLKPNELTKYVPFTLTGEQYYVVCKIIDRITSGDGNLDGLLIGDVGTGKTVILALAARQVLFSKPNNKVIFLAPNVSLCEQLCNEVGAIIPEVDTALLCGDHEQLSKDARLIFGTTALLNKQFDNVDLLIIDEQQQLSVEQRRKIKATHYLEASATPIPRTLALSKHRSENVFFLKQQHLPKDIFTRIVYKEHGADLMKSIQETLSLGAKVLIVCPKRDSAGGASKATNMIDAESLANNLNTHFPSLVRVYHSALDDEECEIVLNEFKTHIPILVSTSKIQVGLTIPNLRHCIVYGAERFGLTTLHQIRGRLARTAPATGKNWGKFDLFLPNKPSENTLLRLNVLTKSSDGFYVSERDLEIRGGGELIGGKTQHGSTNSIIKNVPIELARVAAAIEFLEKRLT
ncbi:DEAD/DEAH box helicase [Pseudoalteromonas sp. SK20]|uniref:DEAD/DEAH box helicase n=1 Tax=Pseudoalteromonas sp. SK20 TaxID=1938367 RepID=UPI000976D79F|nr:DEAD/DEAH box helicase [Pseudoalteromonas sp. SK20]